ncbi:MAG: hypothetical protein PHS80_10495 [Methanothrix sp.]|nr:hypothetical protein [Methanothrix sp.]MDD4448876.1 hypothetical protein [Methanothrix sp.]
MIQLDVYGPPFMEYQGKGSLIFDEATQVQVDFRCIQLHNSKIYAHVHIIEMIDFNIINNKNRIDAIRGLLEDGRLFESIGDVLVQEWITSIGDSTSVEGLLIISQIRIESKKNGTTLLATRLKFYLTNLRFMGSKSYWPKPNIGLLKLPLEINGLNITIYPYINYDKLVKKMELTKTSTVTSYMETDLINLSKKDLLTLVAKLCSLISFAKGTAIICPCYQEVDDTGSVIASFHRSCITSNFGTWELISQYSSDLKQFIETTFNTYVRLLDEYKLNKIIHIIISSKLDTSFLELKALASVSAIDVMRGRWAKSHGKIQITSRTKFDICEKQLKDLIKNFEKLEICPDQINQMIKKIPELNRPSLADVLKEMVFDIQANISEDEIVAFTKTRNKLVHESHFATEDSYQEFSNIIYLADQLIIALLNYQGPHIDRRSWRESKSHQPIDA